MKKYILFLFLLVFSVAGFAQDWTDGSFPKSEKVQVFLYPNPLVGDDFKVKSNNQPSHIVVINSIGQIVYRNEKIEYSFNGEYDVNLINPERGLYLVKIEYPGKRPVVKKLLIK